MELVIAVALAAAALGFAAAWLPARARRAREEQARAEAEEVRERLEAGLKDARAEASALQLALVRAEAQEEAERRRAEAALGERDARLSDQRQQAERLARELQQAQGELRAALGARAALEAQLAAERAQGQEKLALVQDAERKLAATFQALSAQALQQSSAQLQQLAQQQLEKFQEGARGDLERRQASIRELVQPVRESLERLQGQLQGVEKERAGAYAGLSAQVRQLQEAHGLLRTETGNLVTALRAPQVRGRWGELQLQRVLELSGMREHCDFEQQVVVSTEEGALRPDLVVNLPGGKQVVIDAKVPLQAYLDAVNAPDEPAREARLLDHARQLRQHAAALARKGYWQQFDSPELVILFVPNEGAYEAALRADPALFETSLDDGVLLANPGTLIAYLRSMALAWRQEKLARNAQEISELGRALYDRIARMAAHFERLGKKLGDAVEAYNDTVGSLERRVLPGARRFVELKAATSEEIAALAPVAQGPRPLQQPELRAAVLPDDAN